MYVDNETIECLLHDMIMQIITIINEIDDMHVKSIVKNVYDYDNRSTSNKQNDFVNDKILYDVVDLIIDKIIVK